MWTHSYVPARDKMVLLVFLTILLALLTGLLLWVRSAPCPRTCPMRHARTPAAQLALDGTPGACVRMDGHAVGTLPMLVDFTIARPHHVMIDVCHSGYLDQSTVLYIAPGEQAHAEFALAPSDLADGPDA